MAASPQGTLRLDHIAYVPRTRKMGHILHCQVIEKLRYGWAKMRAGRPHQLFLGAWKGRTIALVLEGSSGLEGSDHQIRCVARTETLSCPIFDAWNSFWMPKTGG